MPSIQSYRALQLYPLYQWQCLPLVFERSCRYRFPQHRNPSFRFERVAFERSYCTWKIMIAQDPNQMTFTHEITVKLMKPRYQIKMKGIKILHGSVKWPKKWKKKFCFYHVTNSSHYTVSFDAPQVNVGFYKLNLWWDLIHDNAMSGALFCTTLKISEWLCGSGLYYY